MKRVASNRATVKNSARSRARLEETGSTTVLWRDKKPRGAARLADGRGIVFASILHLATRGASNLRRPRIRRTACFVSVFGEVRELAS